MDRSLALCLVIFLGACHITAAQTIVIGTAARAFAGAFDTNVFANAFPVAGVPLCVTHSIKPGSKVTANYSEKAFLSVCNAVFSTSQTLLTFLPAATGSGIIASTNLGATQVCLTAAAGVPVFQPCSATKPNSQRWRLNSIGQLSSVLTFSYLDSGGAAARSPPHAKSGDGLVLVSTGAPTPTQTWIYQPSSVAAYANVIMSQQVAGSCITASAASVKIAPCSASAGQVFTAVAVNVTVVETLSTVTGAVLGSQYLVHAASSLFPSSGFPLKTFKLVSGGKCLTFSCDVSNCSVLLKTCSAVAPNVATTIPGLLSGLKQYLLPAPGPADVFSVDLKGHINAYFSTPSNNPICLGTTPGGGVVVTDCSFQSTKASWVFLQPGASLR